MAWRASPGTALAWIGLLLLIALLPIAIARVGKAIVDAVMARQVTRAVGWVLAEMLVMASLGAANRGATMLRTLLGVRMALSVNLEILRKIQSLGLLQFQDPVFYDKLTRARREASHRPLAVAAELLSLVSSVATLLGFVLLLLSFSPSAVLLLLLASVPAALAELRFSRDAFDLRNRRISDARMLGYLEHVLASDEHAKEVMLLGLGPTLLERYRTVGERLWREEWSLSLRRNFWVISLSQLGTLTFYGCYVYIAWLAVSGRLSLGDMTMYVLAFRQGQFAFQGILLSLGTLFEHDLYMSNLLQFLGAPAGASPRLLGAPPAREERGIRFEDVGFRYPERDAFALRHLDLFIPPGESLALVGHNGAGKTTFLKLLVGLYEPTEGRVLLDGRDLRSIPQEELRARFAVIFQDFNQYQLPVRENIGFGSVPHAQEETRVQAAAERGGARDVIEALPAGLDTQLGRWFDGGVELSGGQWQRVALARAFMREEAEILILDEPTAALDVDAEAEVFEQVRRFRGERTLLLISHRFANVRAADRILVLEGSGILEQGTHEELMALDGVYAAMFRKQAEGYA
jgi:ATP-binding cassette subfamily B protein